MEYKYWLLDVFTNQPFGGNPLAVFCNDVPSSTEMMQKIAKELNLSETVFVFPGSNVNQKRLRIFTPNAELPMAGHPTIGTAYLLAKKGIIKTVEGVNSYIFEENVGPIEVIIYKQHGEITKIDMIQPIPQFKERFEDIEKVAHLLSLSIDEIDSKYPIQTISSGVPFLYVPLKTLQSVSNIQFRLDVWNKYFSKNEETSHIFVFTTDTKTCSHVHSRMFAPAMGIHEDPATGAASGPLGAYLVTYGLVNNHPSDVFHIISEQGMEMNRPSYIHITVTRKEKEFNRVTIGGNAVIIGRGELWI